MPCKGFHPKQAHFNSCQHCFLSSALATLFWVLTCEFWSSNPLQSSGEERRECCPTKVCELRRDILCAGGTIILLLQIWEHWREVFQHSSSVLGYMIFVLFMEGMNTTIFCSCSLLVVCEGPTAAVNSTKGKAYLFSASNIGFIYWKDYSLLNTFSSGDSRAVGAVFKT